MEHIAIGAREPELLSSLAGRLIRLEKRIELDVRAEVEKLSGGKTLSNIARDLLDAIDPDKVEHASRLLPDDRKPEAYATLANQAVAPIATNPDLRNKILAIQRAADQTIDTVSQDKLLFAGADAKTSEAARTRSSRSAITSSNTKSRSKRSKFFIAALSANDSPKNHCANSKQN